MERRKGINQEPICVKLNNKTRSWLYVAKYNGIINRNRFINECICNQCKILFKNEEGGE